MNTIIEGLRDWLGGCPLLAGGVLHVDFLPGKSGARPQYSIDAAPGEDEMRRFMGGGRLCRYGFCVPTVGAWGPDDLQNLANSGFFERLADWMRRQSRDKNLPALPAGAAPRRVVPQSMGYLYDTSPGNGKYQMQCALEYYRPM